jgi:hypothetical protein
VNEKLLEELEGRIDNWSPEQKIGDVFLTFVPFLKTYTIYSSNYSSGITFTPSRNHTPVCWLLLSLSLSSSLLVVVGLFLMPCLSLVRGAQRCKRTCAA